MQDVKIFQAGRFRISLHGRTCVMGVLNLTPDSFFPASRTPELDRAVAKALKMEAQGADIIDVGAESSRPGSLGISAEEEMNRLRPVLRELIPRLNIPVSVDTGKAAVARMALSEGASMLNDVGGGLRDPEMLAVLRQSDAGICLMHMQGTPRTMQTSPVYRDVVSEVLAFLDHAARTFVAAGVHHDRLCLDPGIGFGKTLEDNLRLQRGLAVFCELGFPILVGPSRKSFIGTILQDQGPEDRLLGTAAAVAVAIGRGANIVRVHDVAEMLQVVRVADAICHGNGSRTPAPGTGGDGS